MKALPPFLFLILLPAASQSPLRSHQALLELLGEDLEALLSEREGDPALLPQDLVSRLLKQQRPASLEPPTPGLPPEAWAHLLSDLLKTQKRLRWRPKKATMGQQGCFGIKLDRIGTLSGLGC
ncbi:C-type natriuretic peptide 1-like [Anolis carolinensis]|uniref:C-type natriuretic peptide 1-like n=1 Tax=Anolis carolinensis TaxID=28377 RepID=UPI002F2B22CE